jgi:hypothetical protein
MYAIDTAGPPRQDVRAALLWALENDRSAFLAHREVMQYRRWDDARTHADRRLVRRWRESFAGLHEQASD